MTIPTDVTRGFAILRGDVTDAASTAAAAEQLGYHAAWSPEFYTRSAIVSLAAMAQVTSTARIGSSIAYAVGRTPLVLATEARSLDELSHGRLIYGLGTGTTKMMAGWHGVDPSGPASRMEELIPLLRSLWRLHEGPVRHDGRFYHVDVTPTAEMPPPPRTDIPVFTAGVNTRMVQVAGRVSDGFLGHPLFSPRYYDDVVRPAIDAMAAAVPDAMVDAMSAAGTPAQVAAKLEEFGRHMDHVIVYPASFGMTDERSRQVTADLLSAGAPAKPE